MRGDDRREYAGEQERRSAVSKYAVYASSRIYHLMRDEQHTRCGIPVFESNPGDHYRRGGAVLEIVESAPAGLRLCPHCSDESNKKKGSKK